MTINVTGKWVFEEHLPFPWVEYPEHYGTFIGFASDPDSKSALCHCMRDALDGYIHRRLKSDVFCALGVHGLLNPADFPLSSVSQITESMSDSEIFEQFSYLARACHVCNSGVPEMRYAHPMYAGLFEQCFGWYLKQRILSSGVDANRETVENALRLQLGFPKFRRPGVAEHLLFLLVKSVIPNVEVRKRCRLKELDGLELDIYFPSMNFAIEYQGQQHYKGIEAWGGADALQKRRRSDRRKAALCKRLGIRLVKFNYRQVLSSDFIRDRLSAIGVVVANDGGEQP